MNMEKDKLEELKLLSAKIRKDVLEMLEKRGYGHMGGSLSIVELMSVLYGKQLRYDAKNPDWEERDMVVLSKGHSGPAWYSVLAEKGFFDREWLFTLNDGGTKLPSASRSIENTRSRYDNWITWSRNICSGRNCNGI